MKKGSIYLDNSTLTRPSDIAVSRMIPYLSDYWGALSSPHQMGQSLFPAAEESYRAIYSLLDAKETDDFVLTSSGAEAVNQVIFSGYYDTYLPTGRNHFITSHVDEAPAIMAIGRLEKMGCVGKMVAANAQGQVTAQAVSEALTPRTALVSLSWANGLTGVINPVHEIADLCQERGVRLHLDATHVLGKLFFERDDVGADFLTFNGAHLHAPKGSGGLWIKEGVKLSPFIAGGSDQAGRRAGYVDIAALVALGWAAFECLDNRNLLCTEVARLRDRLETGILEGFPDAVLFFKDQERLPHCCAIGFPGIVNEAMLYALSRKGVFASIGGGNFQQIGLVLAASGVDETLAHTAVNFSLSRETREDEIDRAVEIIVETANKLRKLSGRLIPAQGE